MAMPTAIPEDPLIMRFGNLDGRTEGSTASVIVVRDKFDGLLVKIWEQFAGNGHSYFGVSHGRGGVSINGAKVSLAIDQGIAKGEVLGESHNAIIRRASPWGWYFPITSPTIRADFL